MASSTSGFEELNAMLRSLPDKVARKHLKGAAQNALTPALREVKSRAKPLSRTLARGYRKHVVLNARTGTVTAKIGARKTKDTKTGRKASSISHLVELGTKPHKIERKRSGLFFKRAIKHPGTAARPHLKPAFDASEKEVLDVFSKELARKIDQEARKA